MKNCSIFLHSALLFHTSHLLVTHDSDSHELKEVLSATEFIFFSRYGLLKIIGLTLMVLFLKFPIFHLKKCMTSKEQPG